MLAASSNRWMPWLWLLCCCACLSFTARASSIQTDAPVCSGGSGTGLQQGLSLPASACSLWRCRRTLRLALAAAANERDRGSTHTGSALTASAVTTAVTTGRGTAVTTAAATGALALVSEVRPGAALLGCSSMRAVVSTSADATAAGSCYARPPRGAPRVQAVHEVSRV